MADSPSQDVAKENPAQRVSLIHLDDEIKLKPKSTNDCQVSGCDYNRRRLKNSSTETRTAAFKFPKNTLT
jgi:hypothetical protein